MNKKVDHITMDIMVWINIYIVVLGMVLGSFFHVVAWRVPEGQSIVHPPSSCSHCQHRLSALDMIPVLSYIGTKGRCRHCGTQISIQYPLGEAITGLLFLWIFLHLGWTGDTLIGWLLVSLSVIITLSDLQVMKIPNKVLLFFAPIFLIMILWLPGAMSIFSHLGGAITGGGILLLIAFISRGGMGMGDVKLFALYGWVVGFSNILLALFIACLLGTLVGMGLRLLGKVQKQQPIPFGPFLAAGTLIAFMYGSQIIDVYLSLIG